MISLSSALAKLDRLLQEAKLKHVGPPLYLLTPHQRAIWDRHQHEQSKAIEAFEAENGQHSYIKAIFDGHDPCGTLALPRDIQQALNLGRTPPGIPVDASANEARLIYEEYLND